MGEAAKIVEDIKAVIKISSKGNAIFYGPGGHRRNKIFPECQLTPDLVQTLIDLNNTHDRVKVKVDVVDGSGKIKSILICGFAPGKAKDKAKGSVFRHVREDYSFRLEEVGCAESDWVYGYRLQYTVLADGIDERPRFCTEPIPYATEVRRDVEVTDGPAGQHNDFRAVEESNNQIPNSIHCHYDRNLKETFASQVADEDDVTTGATSCLNLCDDLDPNSYVFANKTYDVLRNGTEAMFAETCLSELPHPK